MEAIYSYTIKLIRYVLNGDVPELPDNIDFEKLFSFGRSHGVENMLYIGLRDLNINVPEQTMKKFKTAYEMQIMLEATQALELEAIGEAFEEAGIDYVPLKGSVIKYLYPMPDYRKSGDIDILIKPMDEDNTEKIMLGLGYKKIEELDDYEVHTTYKKAPYMEIEIHRQLTTHNSRTYKFCAKAWEHTVLNDGYKHQYSFEDEYLYMHLMAHLCHHLYEGGAGIRLITDFYVLLKNKKLSDDVIDKYMKKARLTALNQMAVGLMKKWFMENNDVNNDVCTLEKLVLVSGSFGTKELKGTIRNSDTGIYKLRHFIKQLFPPARELKARYKLLENRPYLVGVMWVYRFFDIIKNENNTISKKVGDTFDNSKMSSEIQIITKAVRDIR
ncbi:MAG: nucleotidyltransferase family protein [Candidatus Ornithomonoglobus sp.]